VTSSGGGKEERKGGERRGRGKEEELGRKGKRDNLPRLLFAAIKYEEWNLTCMTS